MKTIILTVLISIAGLAVMEANAQDNWEDDWAADKTLPVEVHGFAEAAAASRVDDDKTQSDHIVLNEARFRLDLARYGDLADFYFKGDFVADQLSDGTNGVDTDIRQAAIAIRASSWLDIKVGRQVLTWGTGDLVFLNDLFPKDWQSFFTGRDDEYLKAPSNSMRLTFYAQAFNVDLVWTPTFEPDRFITGERLSFFSPMAGGLVSAESMGGPVIAADPARTIDNGELAVRLFRNVKGYELALYGYTGFIKRPLAFDPLRGLPTYSELSVYGASVRGNFLGGVANIEGAFYDSRHDRDGIDPFTPNSELRWLGGYERELFANLTIGLQYYAEWLQNYDELLDNSPAPQYEAEEIRHLMSTRLMYRLRQQTVTMMLFAFYSPNDKDAHLRPSISYKWSDAVAVTAGGNVMFGDDDTFFGQLEENNNAYFRIRYSF
ncbi:MAG: hypothetical protein ABIA59_10840 [Candidatus Latescibacterota bacterium]